MRKFKTLAVCLNCPLHESVLLLIVFWRFLDICISNWFFVETIYKAYILWAFVFNTLSKLIFLSLNIGGMRSCTVKYSVLIDLATEEIEGSLSSSWMNRPTPSLLRPLFQNETAKLFVWKYMSPAHSFAGMKIKLFSCETFCTSTHSEKEANFNSDVEVKTAYVPSGPSG